MKLTIAAAAAALALGVSGTASAAVWTTALDWSNLGAGGSVAQNASSFGTVTITEVNANTVDILVTLASGLAFVDTGNATNHFPFSFNLMNTPGTTLSIVEPNPNVDIVTTTGGKKPKTDVNAKWTYTGFGSFNQSAFGNMANAFDCCGNGGSDSRPSPFEFQVSNPGGLAFLTGDTHFFSNDAGWWFVSDVLNTATGKTFIIGGRDAICQQGCPVPGGNLGVPEPSTWALMILGFGTAGAMLRRRQVLMASA
jgi:hypothetical protein